MEKKLEVKNLQISFRTQAGVVKAVRNISFDLNKGETLAIVGESGSGKSVTSKAVIGILAGNSIVEGGEIIYDGQDLLKISEEDFHKIRGSKIAMIFQDPMSSLNPIMRVGRQLTEAMILTAKANAKSSRHDFNSRLRLINNILKETSVSEEEIKENNELCKTFDSFCIESTKNELKYNNAVSQIVGLVTYINKILFLLEKNQNVNCVKVLKYIKKVLPKCYNHFLFKENETVLGYFNRIDELVGNKDNHDDLVKQTSPLLKDIKAYLEEVQKKDVPNFFTLGYYFYRNPDANIKEYDTLELNKMTREYIDKEFMLHFIEKVSKVIEYSHIQCKKLKANTLKVAVQTLDYLEKSSFDKNDVFEKVKQLIRCVNLSIDRMELVKNSAQYSFGSAVITLLNAYYKGVKTNPKNQAKYDKKLEKYNNLVKAGKRPTWQVTPPMLVDLELAKNNIFDLIRNLIKSLENDINNEITNFDELGVATIDKFKDEAQKVVYKVTKSMAKAKAIKLLEEVGISEPEIRYYQYPFEFSGGMRQRIVIAIALAANPDILICDEPTTALDVTIQSQILELINKIKAERKLSVIFITHDLGVVANMADRIAVMYAGKIVEYGTSEDIFYDPRHPYTWALLSSMPDLDTKDKLEAIPGTPPNMIFPPKGDAFAERNKYAMKIDFEMEPPMFKVSDSHYAATWLLHPNAPKVNPPKIITDRIERMKGAQHE